MLNEDSDSGTTETPAAPPTDPRDAMVTVAKDQVDHWYGYNPKTGDEDQILTLDDAIEHVLEQHMLDGARRDVKVEDLNAWIFGTQDGLAVIGAEGHDDGNRSCFPRATAFGQLCERAKAPPRYLCSIPARYTVPALNWGIKHRADGPALIRFAGDDEARAILSQRYARFDDHVVLPTLRSVLGDAGLLDAAKARVVATGLTTLVRLSIEGDAIAIPGTNEIAEVALDFANGEVGNRAVALSPSVYLRNSTVSTRQAGMRLRHLGTSDKLEAEFREALPDVLARSRKLRAQIVTAVDRAISDLVNEAEKLQAFGLSKSEARDVLRTLAKDAGVDLPHDTAEWEEPIKGVANVRAYDVFLAVAKLGDGRPVDRRMSLEEAAAKYLARATK